MPNKDNLSKEELRKKLLALEEDYEFLESFLDDDDIDDDDESDDEFDEDYGFNLVDPPISEEDEDPLNNLFEQIATGDLFEKEQSLLDYEKRKQERESFDAEDRDLYKISLKDRLEFLRRESEASDRFDEFLDDESKDDDGVIQGFKEKERHTVAPEALTDDEWEEFKVFEDIYEYLPNYPLPFSNPQRIYRIPKPVNWDNELEMTYDDLLQFKVRAFESKDSYYTSALIEDLMRDLNNGRDDYPVFGNMRSKSYRKKRTIFIDRFQYVKDYMVVINGDGDTLLSEVTKDNRRPAHPVFPYGKQRPYNEELKDLVATVLSGDQKKLREEFGPLRNMPTGGYSHLIDPRAKDVQRFDQFGNSFQFNIMGKTLDLDVSDYSSLLELEPVDNIHARRAFMTRPGTIRTIEHNRKYYETSEEDRDLILFLGQFRYAPPFILKNIHGISEEAVRDQLTRLEDIGLVRCSMFPGLGDLWVNTPFGQEFASSPLTAIGRGLSSPKPTTVVPHLFAAYVASFLWCNRANVLHLKDFPFKGLPDGRGGVRRGERVVSESMIRWSYRLALKEVMDEEGIRESPYKGFFMEKLREKKDKMLRLAELNNERWPELIAGNEFMFANFTLGMPDRTRHIPDLIVKRERDEDGNPMSLAIEVERVGRRKPEDYAETFEAYQNDGTTINRVVWIVDSIYVANRVREGAKIAKFKNYDILPFMDETGPVNFRHIWYKPRRF